MVGDGGVGSGLCVVVFGRPGERVVHRKMFDSFFSSEVHFSPMDTRNKAGWLALFVAIALATDAAVARWFPAITGSGTEGTIIAAFLAFAAAAFGFSTWAAGKNKQNQG